MTDDRTMAVESFLDSIATYTERLMGRHKSLSNTLVKVDYTPEDMAILSAVVWSSFSDDLQRFMDDCAKASKKLGDAFEIPISIDRGSIVHVAVPVEGRYCPDCETQLVRYADESDEDIRLLHCEECGRVIPLTRRSE